MRAEERKSMAACAFLGQGKGARVAAAPVAGLRLRKQAAAATGQESKKAPSLLIGLVALSLLKGSYGDLAKVVNCSSGM